MDIHAQFALKHGADRPDTGTSSAAAHFGAGAPIHSLTGLRFVAALLVLFSHFPELVPFDAASVGIVRQGAAGVTIFFVLSGTVLTYNYLHQFSSSLDGARRFMGMRLARIAPMNTVALLVVTAVIVALGGPTPSALSWLLNLVMLHSLLPIQSMHLWNIPAWSISSELCFYAVFPLFVRVVLARIKRGRSLAVLGTVLVVMQVIAFVAVMIAVERHKLGVGGSSDDVITMLERIKFHPGLRIFEFLLGCTVGASLVSHHERARSWSVRSSRRLRDAMLVACVTVMIAVLLIPVMSTEPTEGRWGGILAPGLYLVYTPAAVLLVGALAHGPTALSPVLAHRSMRRLGDTTLSFYLLQWPIVLIVDSASWAPERNIWFSAFAVGVLLAVSLLTARWIERPARDWWRQRQFRESASGR